MRSVGGLYALPAPAHLYANGANVLEILAHLLGGRSVCPSRHFICQHLAENFALSRALALLVSQVRKALILHARVHVDEPVVQEPAALLERWQAQQLLSVPPHLGDLVACSAGDVDAPAAPTE